MNIKNKTFNLGASMEIPKYPKYPTFEYAIKFQIKKSTGSVSIGGITYGATIPIAVFLTNAVFLKDAFKINKKQYKRKRLR